MEMEIPILSIFLAVKLIFGRSIEGFLSFNEDGQCILYGQKGPLQVKMSRFCGYKTTLLELWRLNFSA